MSGCVLEFEALHRIDQVWVGWGRQNVPGMLTIGALREGNQELSVGRESRTNFYLP